MGGSAAAAAASVWRAFLWVVEVGEPSYQAVSTVNLYFICLGFWCWRAPLRRAMATQEGTSRQKERFGSINRRTQVPQLPAQNGYSSGCSLLFVQIYFESNSLVQMYKQKYCIVVQMKELKSPRHTSATAISKS